ncbi:MAG: CvpA family protein [Flavobacteriia bacterium]|nr:CvpA family protein [Flavobacteriia bacterium]
MNWLDGIITIGAVLGAFWGFKNGFIKAFLGFVAIGAAVWAGFKFSGLLEKTVADSNLVSEEWIPFASIIFTVILVYAGIKLIAKIFTGLAKAVGLGLFNRLGGAVFGILINMLLLSAILSYMLPFMNPETAEESRFFPLLSELAEMLGANIDLLKGQLNDELTNQLIQKEI